MRGLFRTSAAACLLLLGGVVGCGGSSAYVKEVNLLAPTGTGFVDKTVKTADGEQKYVVFAPYDYSPKSRLPMIVFLNGYGEAGTDNRKQLSVGLGPAIEKKAKDFPFVVLFVQADGWWHPDGIETRTLMAAMDKTIAEYNIDTSRVVLTGMSTGGQGVWKIGAAHKNRFAALVPVCGWSATETVDQLTDIPIWAFHCSGDPLIFSGNSSGMVDAINKKGGHAKLTKYGDLAHNAWSKTYSDPDVYAWMLQQKRATATARADAPKNVSTN